MRTENHRWAWLTLFVVALASFSGAGDGRWKLASDGSCYLDRNDQGPDQCSPSPGRWKLGGDQSCYWDDDDSGPDQCQPILPPQ